MASVERAQAIAAEAHAGKSDKLGRPYIEHCKRVADAVLERDQKIVAWLHDVLEKGPNWTADRLHGEGFSHEVIQAVEAMTRRDGEPYLEFVRRAASNALARPVKHADLVDNARQARKRGKPSQKYDEALAIVAQEYRT